MKEKINLEDLSSKNPKIKYSCIKNLLVVAENNPSSLYPQLDYFVELLGSENQILKWSAIEIIGYLSRVDEEKKVDKLIGKFFGFLNSGELITANHAILALSNIVIAKPRYQDKITDELMKVEHYKYDTDECRNIAIGKVILALQSYIGDLAEKKEIIKFAKRQTKNTRPATRKKAEQLLKKLNRTSENKH